MNKMIAGAIFAALGLSACDTTRPSTYGVEYALRKQTPAPDTRLQEPLLPIWCRGTGPDTGQDISYRIQSLDPKNLELVTAHHGRPQYVMRLQVTAVSDDLIAAAARTIRRDRAQLAQVIMIAAQDQSGRREATFFASVQTDRTAEPVTLIAPLVCEDGA